MGDRHMPEQRVEDRGKEAVEESYAAALDRERRRRAELEKHLHELAEENRRSRKEADERDRLSRVRDSLRERGVKKTDLALRVVGDEVKRGEDGALYGELAGERVPLEDYLGRFLAENPEFLPPRISGGAGIPPTDPGEAFARPVQMDDIRPGMSNDDARRAWEEVARLMGGGVSR